MVVIVAAFAYGQVLRPVVFVADKLADAAVFGFGKTVGAGAIGRLLGAAARPLG